MTSLQLLVLFGALAMGVNSYNVFEVPCDHATPVCECPLQDGEGGHIDVCEFLFVIGHLQTFTRYRLDRHLHARSDRGRVWYINATTGDLQPYPSNDPNSPCSIPANDLSCTLPFTVDGRTFRSFIAVNDQLPGPTLIVNHNQVVVVRVVNRLASESISIHWHGMKQRKTNWMDGVEHITQCGISPGNNFTYIFLADPAGTSWYHSHSGAQRTDGLFGSLVVRETPEDLAKAKAVLGYEFEDKPEDHTLSFLDWQRKSSIDLYTLIHSSIHFFNNEDDDVPMPPFSMPSPTTSSSDGAEVGPVSYWSGLINGKGRHQDIPYIQTRLSIFNVLPNTTYRFRLVGAQSLYTYRVSVDEHKLIVIATDGAFIQPVTVDYIIIHTGERYDFLLASKTTEELAGKSNFLIRAETLETMDSANGAGPREPIAEEHIAEAILHYDSNISDADYQTIAKMLTPRKRNCTAENQCVAFNCPFKKYPPTYFTKCLHIHEQVSLHGIPEYQLPNASPDAQLFLNFGFEGIGETSSINGRNLQLPSSPLALLNDTQLQAEEKNEFCKDLDSDETCDNINTIIENECVCTHVKSFSFNQSVQMVISAVGPKPTDLYTFLNAHPIHLHGHYFHVVDIQYGEYDSNALLISGNTDINCGGQDLCTNPRWRNPNQASQYYSGSQNGKINATAPLKDTLIIPAGGYAVVYFQTDNPGYWFLHCHIEVHQLEGMGVIIQEAADMRQPPPSGFGECGNFDWTIDDFYNHISAGALQFKAAFLPILIFNCILGIVGAI